MKPLVLKAHAKLNLALVIRGRRPDGFHELKTVFERIDLHDDLAFTSRPDGKIKVLCTHPAVPRDERNLAYRAALLLKTACQVQAGATIRITKRIPVAAGLAGGSSNAATTLMGLNRVWKLGLSLRQLGRLAAAMGSDINFFLHDASWGVGTGRGEKVRPLKINARFWHVLVVPEVAMLTPEVYGLYAERFGDGKKQGGAGLTKVSDNVNLLLRSLRKKDIGACGRYLYNDLEKPILALRPDFAAIKASMTAFGVPGVCFSGSGPSVYALMPDKKSAAALALWMARSHRQVFVVGTA
jgi:4-diphosphocytidyl-2-C-methyl-D-erythritol kinase